jgi:8-oxo-dGTP diphosphatase
VSQREYPDRPLVGVGGVVIEETGLDVRVGALIEVFERIIPGEAGRTRYHFVILDYLCERVSGKACAASDVTDAAWVREDELEKYGLTAVATRVIRRAFEMNRAGAA